MIKCDRCDLVMHENKIMYGNIGDNTAWPFIIKVKRDGVSNTSRNPIKAFIQGVSEGIEFDDVSVNFRYCNGCGKIELFSSELIK